MRRRLALAGCALLVGVTALMVVVQTRASRPAVPPAASATAGSDKTRERAEDSPKPVVAPHRNVFEYLAGDSRAFLDPAPIPSKVSPPPPLTPPVASPIRLIGLVTRPGGRRAALLVSGEIAVLGPGEQAGGFTLLSIDDDVGVRVRDRQGTEIVLPIDSQAPASLEGTQEPYTSNSPRT